MRKKIKYIILTIVFIFCIDQILSIYLSSVYEKNFCTHAGGDLNAYLNGKPKDIVLVGSSRVYTMINPDLLGKSAVNISKPAKHLYYNIAVVNLMHQYKKMPKKILIFNLEVEDIYQNNKKRLIEDVSYLKYYYYSNDMIRSIINKRGALEKYKYLFSSYRFNGENFTIVTNPFQKICTTSKNGFIPFMKSDGDSLRLCNGIKEMKAIKLSGINSEFFIKLNHLKKLCKLNNIQLVVINGPNYFLPKLFKKGSLMIQKYCTSKNIKYIDFSLKYSYLFKKSNLWYDHIHLNNIGAEKYTLLLKKELKI
jgi:hypothetical protein